MTTSPQPPPLTIHLLGRFVVLRGETPIADDAWRRRKAQALFKLLAVAPGQRRHKEQIFDFLWPRLEPEAAANNLHKTLYHLRHILCPQAGGARHCPYLEFDGQMVSLVADYLAAVDADQFEAAAKAAETNDPEAVKTAVALYQGQLLPDDLYEEWTIPRRERLHQAYLGLQRRLADLHLARQEYRPAQAIGAALLVADSLDEAAYRLVMRAYALGGQRHQALRQYQLCRETLDEELGIEPSAATIELYQAILDGALAPAAGLTPVLSLPASPFPLVGRQQEQARLVQLLAAVERSQQPHLALVSGEAGVGKSRLAQAVARHVSGQGYPVLVGMTYEPAGRLQELPLPYAPVADALRHFWQGQAIETRRQLVGPRAADLAPLLPELGEGRETAVTDPETTRQRLFDAVLFLLQRIAGRQPLLLLLDDFHAADQATVELAGYLLHRPSPLPLLVLAVVRDGGPRRPPHLENLVARLQRAGRLNSIPLAPLAQAETSQLAADRLDGPVDTAVIEAVHQASEGNPLFAEQLLRAWREEGIVGRRNGRWQLLSPADSRPLPGTLRQTIRSRINRLPPEVQEVLLPAAVTGREFPYRWLAAGGDWPEPTLLLRLDQALEAGILEEV